jgi:hypothetical protein
MSQHKSGLPAYAEGAGAARISEIIPLNVPGIPGCAKLKFSDCDKDANVLGWWMAQSSPQVGGYFVAFAEGGAGYMTAESFAKRFGAPL